MTQGPAPASSSVDTTIWPFMTTTIAHAETGTGSVRSKAAAHKSKVIPVTFLMALLSNWNTEFNIFCATV
ncbi:hypothetical protein EV286_103458 [Rhizobium sp. BK251]|nr:hypothetical protein EV286_103458 [Rhizobium sp. BK251]